MTDVTRILVEIEHGVTDGTTRLFPLVYDELRRVAAARINAEKPGQTLSATALVHEAFLRITGDQADTIGWNSRRHFFGAASEAMRRILVERARQKGRIRHGGGRKRLPLDGVDISAEENAAEIIDLHEALTRFAGEDATRAKLVELRFFAGLSMPEAADVLGISLATAERYWAYARAWLCNELFPESGDTPE